ncbi:hypothetical protein D3869_01445 [Azospirillum brasilense]|uniref:Uncharacterized protein n=1 Tax=Azospirillum brasilense TaxID=192 RepID=A0A4D8QWL8_AZOBR|nr:hypothetical protein [Azospirillum brasilense]QCO14001.1 hypothetical protein D3869_01445 [Azospirillum brasilense]
MGTSPFASKNPFAHLLGRKPSGKKAEEDDRKDDTESKAEDDDADAEEGDETEDEDDKKSKKSKKAEDDSDDGNAENDDSDGDGDTEEDSDKDNAKKASGGKKGKTYADGRAFERARCAKIFGCAAAADRPDVAARLAFNTDMNPDAAVEVLTVAAEAGGRQSSRRTSGLSDRMASVPNPKVGATAPQQQAADPKSPAAVAAAIIEAGKKRRGEK